MFGILFIMSHLLHSNKVHSRLWPVYIANLIFSLHFNVLVYVNSSYLSQYFNLGGVSLLYILGSIGNIILFFLSIRIENHYGNRKFFTLFLLLELIAVGGLAFASNAISIALFFILFMSTSHILLFSLDIFLEDATPTFKTGSIRGIYQTITNLALVLSPLLIAFIAPNGEFTHLYIVSTILIFPLLLLANYSFKGFKDGVHRIPGLPLKLWFKTTNVRRVTEVRHTLDLFYSFMVIFMPIYLHQYIGFSWTNISLIFSVMLLPFIIFEIPVGKLADKWCGEKELMTLGLFIVGTCLIIISFLKAPNMLYWIMVLFASRIGASIIEITCESYFFKHVDKRDTGLISIYRLSWPSAFILGPIIGTFSLSLFPYQTMFLFLSFIVLRGMNTSTKLKDTL